MDASPTALQEPKAVAAQDWRSRLSHVFICTAIGLLVLGGADLFGRPLSIADLFFATQDAAFMLAAAVVLVAMSRARLRPLGEARLRPRDAVLLMAAACAAIAWAGTFVVYDGYALSTDEFMARFDAAIFSQGRLFGAIPREWAAYKTALQPTFLTPTPSAEHWSSSYLPVNAAFRALGRSVGLESLVNPIWTAIGVVATWAVGRRLWPQQPNAAVAAAVFVATSSQVIVSGMTAYAMPAHLALNMAWLWCFLRGGRAGHAAAIAIGFAATGLHQLIFHPLFVAPFVLQLWLDRRWSLAALYTFAYALIGLFWASWWDIAFAAMAFGQAAGEAGAGGLAGRVRELLSERTLHDLPLMARNIARFVAWQNPLAVALAVLGVATAFRAAGALRSLLLGFMLTTLAVAVLLPFQGHGWGYRYVHSVLGSVCLLAGWSWSRLTASLAPEERGKASTAFAVVAGLSILVALPVHAWQAHRFIAPYARASAEIETTDADVVIVDEAGIWYGKDLVRNDPFLRNRPVVLRLEDLEPGEAARLCARYDVTIFDRDDAAAAGVTLIGGREALNGHERRSAPSLSGCRR